MTAPDGTFPTKAGKPHIHYPARGTFKWGMIEAESLNREEYDDLDDDTKLTIQTNNQGWFKATTKVAPVRSQDQEGPEGR